MTDLESATPEDLRQQAAVEKSKYKTLKAERKSEEALRAFKRGKELERQAAALEISLRKNKKKALSSNNIEDTQQTKDGLKAQKIRKTDDLSSELKELGWSDLDLRDAEKKPATLTLEGELSSLLREVSEKPKKEKQTASTDKSQVIILKKRALELKRAGNLLEAKEELKRAKILEKKIEEEELLGESDESDDELSSLIRSMDADEHDDLSARYKPDLNIGLGHFSVIADDLALDGNFEVTEEDMDDPEIVSALHSFGWEEDTAQPEDHNDQVVSSNRESFVTEIQSLKREALNQKRAGNTAEAMSLLKKAKLLEKELENSDSHESDSMNPGSAVIQKDTSLQCDSNDTGPKFAPKSKLTIQRELIALKKKALSLRREGKLDESEEELKKAKALEEQLEEMNKPTPVKQPSISNRQNYDTVNPTIGNGDEEEVTDQDMQDPAYLSLLKNLGWDDEEHAEVPSTTLKENNRSSENTSTKAVVIATSRKSKSEIQRELLTLKRKALTLRRQGEAEEADEVLKMAKSLEAQLEEFEKPSQREDSPEINEGNLFHDAPQNTKSSLQVDSHDSRIGDSEKPVGDKLRHEKPDNIAHESEKPYVQELQSSPASVPQPNSSSLQQEILAHKRKAVAFKREGKLAEAKEELRQAKLLEKSMEKNMPENTTTTNSSDASTSDVSSIDKEASPSSVSKPLSSRDRFKLQQESLGHKRKALKLRREGKTAEADAEFELAKALEAHLQESDTSGSSVNGEPAADASVEDFLDPQLLSALRSIGLEDDQPRSQVIERPETTKSSTDANLEREQLLEQIKTEKVKAVNLKRSGKQAEALDALRRAKLYDKKLQSL